MTMRCEGCVCAMVAVVSLLACGHAAAAAVREGFTETTVASGLASPTAMALAPDGRLFVTQQAGALRVIKNGSLLATPFLTVPVSSLGERGLLGVAFDPGFPTVPYVYVYYTATTPSIHNRVSRFTAAGDVAVPGSEVVLLNLPTLSATNHNGGAIHFGIDGLLYIGVGENAVGDNAQSLSTPLGKILRINADGSIPASNPFFGQTTGNSRAIWALGLRNPFTFTIEPSSGRMLINDVGQDIWEEINEGQAAANYGWPLTEGPTSDSRFVTPLYAYTHADGCAISGGAFYPALPSQYPQDYQGDYFFADFCGGWIRQFDFTTGLNPANFASGIASPVDLLIGPEGALYYLARGSAGNTGTVVRIDFTGSAVPRITQHPASQTVSVGQAVTFAVSASGSALSYQWQRNAVDIAGATSASYTLSSAQLADNGAQFRCRVTNDAGQVFSSVATLTLVESRPPVPTIMTPATGALYTARASVGYSGSATDPEDGVVPASRFTWNIVFHHDTHTHPFLGPIMGRTSGSFAVPNVGETSANVWYRITLTVTDSSGQQASTFRDVRPRTVQVTLATNPSGLMLTLDGQPVVAPFTFTSVVGMRRTIAALFQSADNVSYGFGAWSDRGAQEHTVTTPASNTTFTAAFRKRNGGNGGAVAVKRPSLIPVQPAIPKTAVPRPSD